MAFVKIRSDYVNAKIEQLKQQIKIVESSLKIWNANQALQMMGMEIYVNRQGNSLAVNKGEIPNEAKIPCRFTTREEIELLLTKNEANLEVYKMFLTAIDKGDFLMVDDDPDENGEPGYQLFLKSNPTVDVLQIMMSD
jgi:hypothetical protein